MKHWNRLKKWICYASVGASGCGWTASRRQRAAILIRASFVLLCFAMGRVSMAQTEATAPANLSNRFKFERLPDSVWPRSQVAISILQDRQGFLWFGYPGGLRRYDGYRMVEYKYEVSDPTTLATGWVDCLYEDRAGQLWIGTSGGGLSRYNAATETFTRFVHDAQNPRSLLSNQVRAVFEDRQQRFWVGTDAGLQRFVRDTQEFVTSRFPASVASPWKVVNTLYEDAAGTLWVGTDGAGLLYLPAGTDELQQFNCGPGKFCQNGIWTIVTEQLGRLMLGEYGKGPYSISTTGAPDPIEYPPANLAIHTYCLDRASQLWAGTQGTGVFVRSPVTNSFTQYLPDPAYLHSLSHEKVFKIYEDRQGLVWIGSQNGVNYYDPLSARFGTVSEAFGARDNAAKQRVWGMSQRASNYLWVATDAGLVRFTRNDTGITGRQWFLLKLPVYSVYEDSEGTVWAGTHQGLWQLDAQHQQFRRYQTSQLNPQDLHNLDVFAIVESPHAPGTLWAATEFGLFRLRKNALGKWERVVFVHLSEHPQSINTSAIRPLYFDREGTLWIGTRRKGLNKLTRAEQEKDPAVAAFAGYSHAPDDASSLSSNSIRSLYEDNAGRFWVGTDGGLDLFDRTTGRTEHFTQKNGLPDNTIWGILGDRQGRLWLSTSNGISCFDPEKNTFKNYTERDGLQDQEYNRGAYFQGPQGELFFGGDHGLNAFFPEQIKDNDFVPPIVLTSFERYNTDEASGIAVQEKGLPSKQELQLSYKDNILHFEFASLSFRSPEKNQYAYQLEGYSDQWIQLGAKHDVTFTNLAPGNYTLHVRGSNNDGVWNMNGASLRLVIAPPFWRRWWFVGLELLALISLVGGAFRWRVRTLHQRNEQQQEFARQLIESQESERKRLAAELHDSLGQHLLVIKNRALLGEQFAAEQSPIREQFDEITTSATQAISEVRAISHNLRPVNLERLGLTIVLEEMVERVTQSSGLQFSADIEPLDGLLSKDAEIILYRIVQESVNNILKHSQATKAYLEIFREGDELHVTIRDNGCGYDVAASQRGLGLTSIRERVRLLSGAKTITTAPGAGTKIELQIPLTTTEKE